jgi:hypothetical protein
LFVLTGCTQDFDEFVIAPPVAGDEGSGAAGGDTTGSTGTSSAEGASATGSGGTTSATTSASASSTTSTTTSAAAASSGAGGGAPGPDKCPGPLIDLTLGLPQTISGDTTGASNDFGDPSCGGTQSGEVVYQIHVVTGGDFFAVAEGAHQTLLYAREGCPGTLVHQACGTTLGPSELELYVEAGETFFLFVDGYGVTPQEGPFQLTLEID